MTVRAGQAARASALKPTVWLWPMAAAVLSAWPVWRSVAPETPDIGEGWLRLEVLAGLALVPLYAAWAWSHRKCVADLHFPFWGILLAVYGMFVATRGGDAAGADICALSIAWTASTAIFASLALLQDAAGDATAGNKRLHGLTLLPPSVLLSIAYGVAFLVVVFLSRLPMTALAVMGLISPGAILAWASISSTAGSVLAGRRVYLARAEFLLVLAKSRRWRLLSPAILISERPKLASLYVAEGVRPGDLAALAAALTMDDESELGRAVQEFGVSHRIRLPALKQSQGKLVSAPRRAILHDNTEVALLEPSDCTGSPFDLTPFAEALALAQSLHRSALVVVERHPQPRVLGLIVFAVSTRPGAAEALQALRALGIDLVLAAQPRDARDEAALKSLQMTPNISAARQADGGATVIRPGQSSEGESGGLVLQFGAARSTASPPIAQVIAAREDPRVLADLARFAADFHARTFIVALLSSAPGWLLIAAAFGYVPASPLLVTGVAVVGIVLAVASPQVLRLSSTLAKEVDEE